MHIILAIVGIFLLLYGLSSLAKTQKGKTSNLSRYIFAGVLGILALVVIVRGNIMGALALGTAAVLAWQGSLWSYLGGRAKVSEGRPQAQMTSMTRKEALDILELGPDPTAEEIKDAHHAMMMKNHPDQGGSDYFATKINQAKDILLKS